MRFLFILLFIGLSLATPTIHKYLEKGKIEPIIESVLEGEDREEALLIFKAFADELVGKKDVPAYLKRYVKGLMEEKRGNLEEAIKHYIDSIYIKYDYNPSYYRLNELIRKTGDAEKFREKIKNILKVRFAKTPPVIIDNAPNKYVFLVEKMSQYMFVYKGKKLVGMFPVTTGQAWEDKRREGDKRTPEGIYFFTEYIDVSKLPPLYGNLAVALNYPNPYDRLLGKTGSGIWLHGSDTDNRNNIPFSTRGCVVADNRDLKVIERYINLGNTPIAIYKVVPTGLSVDRVGDMIESWRRAWEEKDFNKYISFYSKRFRWKGGDINGWKRYKRRTVLGKKYIDVDIENITILAFSKHGSKEPLYYVAEFLQTYRSNNYSDKGIKRLYIAKEEGRLKILAEEFIPMREE